MFFFPVNTKSTSAVKQLRRSSALRMRVSESVASISLQGGTTALTTQALLTGVTVQSKKSREGKTAMPIGAHMRSGCCRACGSTPRSRCRRGTRHMRSNALGKVQGQSTLAPKHLLTMLADPLGVTSRMFLTDVTL